MNLVLQIKKADYVDTSLFVQIEEDVNGNIVKHLISKRQKIVTL